MRGADGLQGADGGGGGGGSSELPSQAGNANKVLLTNGAAATWEFVSLALSTTGTLALGRGGTGATDAAGARQALLPAASAGLPLVSDGVSDASFATIAFGSATTGTVALGRGGTGQNTALTAFAALAPAPGAAGRVMVSDGTVDWTASALAIADTTGTLALGRGGTGLTSSGASGNVLRSNGAAWASAALTVADVSGAAPLAAPTFTGAVSMTGASSVVIPTVAWPSNTTDAASTALVTAALGAFVPNVGSVTGTLALANGGTGLTAVGSAGNVLRSTGLAWASAALGVADVVGAAPLNGPNFSGTVSVGAFTATGAAVSLSGATSVSVPTVTLATDSDTSAASTAFVQSAIVSAADPFRRQVLVDQFAGPLFSSQLGWVSTVNGGGAIATANSAVVAGSDGHRTLNPGASAAGRSAMSFESIAGQLTYVTPWSRGKFIKEWRVQVSSIADDFELSVSLGAGAATNSTSLVSGFGAVYTNATAQWTLVSRSAGVTVATQASAVALAVNTWVYIRIELEGASARLYVGATKAAAGTTPVATITTVGASVLALGPMAKITNIGGVSTARNFIVGLYAEDFTLTTPV